MMAQTLLSSLLEWAVRATILSGAASGLLWILRIRDVHFRLTVRTTVLVSSLMMPVAGLLLPRLTIPLPALPAGAVHVPAPENAASAAPPVQLASPSLPPIDAPAPNRLETRTWRERGVDIAAGLWLSIALVLLSRLLIGLRLSSQLARGSLVVQDGVRESHRVRVPITVGLIRPVIVLPADWRAWSEAKRRAVLEHERSHVTRFDPLWQFLASLYCSLSWFHPLAWWLKAELRDLAEAASDDVALRAAGDRVLYAETLLAFFEAAPGRVQFEGMAMATRKTRARRVARILDSSRRLSRPPGMRVAAALVVGSLCLAVFATASRPVLAQANKSRGRAAAQVSERNVTPAAQAPAQSAMPLSSPAPAMCGGAKAYREWLETDVAYIITGQERNVFEQLRTERDCASFVETFWLRRDPKNEFKREHYRRIAYANERYASDLPGWKTDRGRIYITYGPPDEVESHPVGMAYKRSEAEGRGETRTYPSEHWRYRHIFGEVTFEFVDRSERGDYRLILMADRAVRAVLEAGRAPDPGGTSDWTRSLSVRINPNRTLLITIPVDPAGPGESINGRILDASGRTVEAFEDVTNAQTNLYVKRSGIALEPGSYTLVVIRTPASGDRTVNVRRHVVAFAFK